MITLFENYRSPQKGDWILDLEYGIAEIIRLQEQHDTLFYRVRYMIKSKPFIMPVPSQHIRHFGTKEEMETIKDTIKHIKKYNL